MKIFKKSEYFCEILIKMFGKKAAEKCLIKIDETNIRKNMLKSLRELNINFVFMLNLHINEFKCNIYEIKKCSSNYIAVFLNIYQKNINCKIL